MTRHSRRPESLECLIISYGRGVEWTHTIFCPFISYFLLLSLFSSALLVYSYIHVRYKMIRILFSAPKLMWCFARDFFFFFSHTHKVVIDCAEVNYYCPAAMVTFFHFVAPLLCQKSFPLFFLQNFFFFVFFFFLHVKMSLSPLLFLR